jgi:hypothetical protein
MSEVTASAPDAPDGAFLGLPPPVFSAAFHFSFLPRVIVYRLGERRRRSHGFGSHVHVEIPLAIFACILLVVFGLPAALQHGSVGGWVSAAAGACGLVSLLGWSIIGEWSWRRREGYRYGYAEFMPSVFFFCLLLGGSLGLIGGGSFGDDPLMGYLWTGPGLVAGYLAGLFAARWVHALGFIKTWFIYLALLGLVFLIFEDVLMLFLYAGKPGG